MVNKYLYYNEEYNKIIEKLENDNLDIKDISNYILNEKEKEIIIKELKKLKKQKPIIQNLEIIKNTKNKLKEYLNKDFANYLVDYFLGYRQLTKLFDSKDIEEIIINDYDKIFIIDRDQNKILTGISFTEKEYDKFIDVLINTVNKNFNKREFIDGSLPDKSRLNIVSTNVCSFHAITIRKFTRKPLTIIDLINSETVDSYTAAYLWTIIDGFKIRPANIFICGGTGCGKTTFLNVLLDFINNKERIILIEDTNEIDVSNFEDSVSLLSDISNENSLYDITINTLRMRPDRIIIGEVRGKEAQGLFVAMDTGHDGCLATLHANNSEDTINKLLNKPMEISETNIPLLDLIIILKRQQINGKLKRKISQISEITKVGNISLNHIYKENDGSPATTNIMLSQVSEKLCEIINISKNDFKKIVEYRAGLLDEISNSNPKIDKGELKKILHSIEFDYKTILEK
jgi:flagellar protein FlaI